MKKTFELLDKNILNDNFKNIIEICFKYSNCFSLSIHFDFAEVLYSKPLFNNLKPFLKKNFYVQHWHCYYIFDKFINIYIFECNKKSKEMILNSCNNIFLELEVGNFVSEDICFFSNNELLLGTVSHEGICNLYPKSDIMLNSFLKYSSWKEIDYLADEFIKL